MISEIIYTALTKKPASFRVKAQKKVFSADARVFCLVPVMKLFFVTKMGARKDKIK